MRARQSINSKYDRAPAPINNPICPPISPRRRIYFTHLIKY